MKPKLSKKPALKPNEPSQSALKFFKAAQSVAFNLAERWQDERGHENIEDYKVPMDKIAKKFGVVITKMTKRPFGCEFKVDGRTFSLSCKMNGEYAYKRIA